MTVPVRPAALTQGKDLCPRCGCRTLDPVTLICLCGTEFTPTGLAYVRSLPVELQRRTD